MKWLVLLAVVIAACIPPETPPPARARGVAGGPSRGGPPPGAGDIGDPKVQRPSDRPDRPDPPDPPDPSDQGDPGGVSTTKLSPMRALEAEVVEAMNRVRADPKAYADELRTYRSYYDDRGLMHIPGHDTPIMTGEGRAAVDEAIRAALAAKPAGRLTVSAGLSRAAREHAEEIGAAGTIDHTNARGEQPHHRMERYGLISGYSGENIGTGDAGGANLVANLFVDDSVPSRGHRTNLLTKAFTKVGVGCAPHIHWAIVCVIDTAEGYTER